MTSIIDWLRETFPESDSELMISDKPKEFKPKKTALPRSIPKMFRSKFKGQCISLTLEGEQCGRHAEEGYKFCWQHLTHTGVAKIYITHGVSSFKDMESILHDEYLKPLRLLDKEPGFFDLDEIEEIHPERVNYPNQVFTQPVFTNTKSNQFQNWSNFMNYLIFDETPLINYPNFHICKEWKYGEFNPEVCKRNNDLSLEDNIKIWKSMVGKSGSEVVFDFPPSVGNGININESGLLYIFCRYQDPMIKDLIKAYPQYNWVWKMPL